MALVPPRFRPTRPTGVNLGMYNIQDGSCFSPPRKIRSMQIVNYDLMLMTDINIPEEA